MSLEAGPVRWVGFGIVALAVFGCGPQVAGTSAARRHSPRPSSSSLPDIGQFVGHWGGHTRGLVIMADRTGTEYVSDGCCEPEVDITFRLVAMHQARGEARADFVVTSFAYPQQALPGPRQRFHLGERGTLILRQDVVTDMLTQATFCDDASNKRWECGA